MADNILFTGEFSNSDIVQGVDEMVNSLKRLQDEEKRLQRTLSEGEAKLTEQNTQLSTMKANLEANTKSSKDYTAENKRLADGMALVNKQNESLNDKLAKQRKELETATATIGKMGKAYDEVKKSVTGLQKETGKPIAPSLTDGKVSNAIGSIRDKVKGLAADFTSNFKSANTAVDSTADSVANVGSSFGPMGIVAGAAIGFVIKKLYEMATALTDAQRVQLILNEGLKAMGVASAEASGEVDILKLRFQLAREGVLDKSEVLKEYNDTLGKTLGVTTDFNIAEQTLIDNAETYIKIVGLKAEAQALANLRIKESEKKVVAGLTDNRNFATKAARYLLHGNDADYEKQVEEDKKRFESNIKNEAQANIDAITKQEMYVQTQLAVLQSQFAGKPKTLTAITGAKKGAREIGNIYIQELEKLAADIAKVNEKGFTDEASITASVEADFKKRDSALRKAFKDKKLTAGQLESLQENLKELQTLTLQKGLDDFAKQKEEYLNKINDQIETLQGEADLKRISLMKEGFERERLTIEAETEKTARAFAQKRDKTIADILKNAAKNGLTEKDVQPQIDAIKDSYSKMLDDLDIIKNKKLQKLSFDTFQKLADDAKKSFDRSELNISQGSLVDIQRQTQLYQEGKLSYQQYQKELTRIAKEESDARYFKEVENIRKQIRLRENQLVVNGGSLTEDQKEQLLNEIQALQKKIVAAETGQAKEGKPESDPQIQRLVSYASAIQEVAQSVIGFWQQANDAEQKSLERSINIQSSRVDAARALAAKGNSEYLRMEEEKQQQLLIRQENAARRQMAINAALQASQLLVAITGAVAGIAADPTGINVIKNVALIVGTLASGYALIKSLQQNQPSFFVGTEDTGRGGNVDGKGGFHSILHPHERVMTAEENRQLRGISNRKVVDIVTEHYRIKPEPSLNLAAMELAGNSNTRFEATKMDGLEGKLDENNILQRGIIRALKGIGVSVNFDKNGVAVSVMEVVDEISKSKKI